MQAWGRGVILDSVVLQVVEPFLDGGGGYIIELIDADDIVFGEDILRHGQPDFIRFLGVHLQLVARMYTREYGLSVIEVVTALSEVEIEDVDGVDLLHLVVLVANLDVLGDGLGNSVEHTLQVVQLTSELNLNDDDFSLAVPCLDVHSVELGVARLLVALALQQLIDDNLFAEQHRDESFQHCKVGFVAQHALHSPVKSYVFIFYLHGILF